DRRTEGRPGPPGDAAGGKPGSGPRAATHGAARGRAGRGRVVFSSAERRAHHMLYEIRTYQVKPGSLAEVEKRFGEAYEYRKKYSPLTAFWHSEVGPLNEIVHVWPYADLAERQRIRAEVAKDAHWPPKIQEFLLETSAEVLVPFDFVAPVAPGKMGPVFEMR